MIKTIENYKNKLVEKIIISKNVVLIKKDAFKGCNLLREVYFEDGNDYVKIEKDAFPEPSIEYLRLSNRLDCQTDAELSAAFNTENLRTVSISNKTDSIHYFYYEEENEKNALKNNHEVLNLENGREDKHFSKDGVWYAGTTICLYPQGKKDKIYRIPDGIEESSFRSIFCNRFVEKIIFPKSFDFEYTDIVIEKCPNLKIIEIEGKNKEIINSFFDRCKNLKYIITDPSNKFDEDVEFSIKEEKIKILSSEKDIFEKENSFKKINNFFKENER